MFCYQVSRRKDPEQLFSRKSRARDLIMSDNLSSISTDKGWTARPFIEGGNKLSVMSYAVIVTKQHRSPECENRQSILVYNEAK